MTADRSQPHVPVLEDTLRIDRLFQPFEDPHALLPDHAIHEDPADLPDA